MSENTWVWCELVCRGCSATASGRSTSSKHIPRAQMVKNAKTEGWVEGMVYIDEMYCSKKCRHAVEGG